MPVLKDMTGQKFSELTVLKRDGSRGGKALWLCLCSCGTLHETTGERLRNGQARSCGCKQHSKKADPKNSSRLHTIWKHMKERCNNPNCARYPHYGGRGIRVCPEWETFTVFYNWAIHNGYKDNLSLERIDVNGNYCPENCTWITMQEQANNKTVTRYLSYNGETHNIAEWGRILNVNYRVIWNRKKLGWSDERTLTTPFKSKGVYLSTKRSML